MESERLTRLINTSFYLLTISLFYVSLYKILNSILILSRSYSTVREDKRKYILKNFIKTFTLMFVLFMQGKTLFLNMFDGEPDVNLIKIHGSIYVANDLTGLLLVPNLPLTTKVHHTMTIFLLGTISYFTIHDTLVIRLILVYTFWSMSAFLVNFHLGLRFFKKEEGKIGYYIDSIIDPIRISAYYNYLICCIFNWSIHIYYIFKNMMYEEFDYLIIPYCLLLVPIINDDLVLMSWLREKKIKYT